MLCMQNTNLRITIKFLKFYTILWLLYLLIIAVSHPYVNFLLML